MRTTPDGPQHLQALDLANQVRLARAEVKRRVLAGEITVADVILEDRWEVRSMAVGDLLRSQHRWGDTRCRRFLALVPIAENKTLGSMTPRQRSCLVKKLTQAPVPTRAAAERVPKRAAAERAPKRAAAALEPALA